MVKVTLTESFERQFKKIKDGSTKEKIKKQIEKIIEDHLVGKPLRYDLKGERTLYIKPYRLIYAVKQDEIILLRFSHRDNVY
ncbi:type II toxin-antitoxin system mRNA interferase toxin, RelE/StbE family [Candidatus Woesearchaeota archaeon]|nr:type II toxin-antitoxin system mRNA interferase toxin, RelE/StbE family [Candidatus Woesearchaeota archaeon]